MSLSRHRFRAPATATALCLSLGLSLAFAVPTLAGSPDSPGATDEQVACKVTKKLVPSCGAWFGVGPNPYNGESWDQALVNFEDTINRTVDIVHYYAKGQTEMFPSDVMLTRANEPGRERLLLINWKPTDMTWAEVADGDADEFLKDLAQHIKQVYPDPFFLSLDAEPEDKVIDTAGSGMTADDFHDFFRHTVKVLRANGAKSVVTVMNYMGAPHWPEKDWFEDLYPGNKYVDWLAEDQYAFGAEPGVWLSDFAGMVDRHYEGEEWPGFYTWAMENYPDKPIMLGEWGVEEKEEWPDYKPDFFDEMLGQLKADFPNIQALVYWDSDGDTMVGDTRPHSSPESLEAHNDMADSKWFVDPGEYYLGRDAVR